MLELLVELDVYGADLWMYLRERVWSGFGEGGGWVQAKMKLALISNMMNLLMVKTQTQFKSESLKLRENTIKENLKEMVHNMLVVW